MDSLLEKLRAAGPQPREQRDRRRRARLKEKHDQRVASGEKIRDLADLTRATNGTASSNDGGDSDSGASGLRSPDFIATPSALRKEAGVAGPEDEQSEGEEVADRAMLLLHGLRQQSMPADDGLESALHVRRRRENGEERRNARREARRKQQAAARGDQSIVTDESATKDLSNSTKGVGLDGAADDEDEDDEESAPSPVKVSVSPPDPGAKDGTKDKPVELSD